MIVHRFDFEIHAGSGLKSFWSKIMVREGQMPEPVTKAVAQEQPGQIKTRNSITRFAGIASVATAVAMFPVLIAVVVHAQEKYSLKSPSGIAFSAFRGYEDWSVVSSARTE